MPALRRVLVWFLHCGILYAVFNKFLRACVALRCIALHHLWLEIGLCVCNYGKWILFYGQVLQELIGNEKKFVSIMEELLETYLSPLEANDSLWVYQLQQQHYHLHLHHYQSQYCLVYTREWRGNDYRGNTAVITAVVGKNSKRMRYYPGKR